MSFELFGEYPILRGVVLALLGVGFWVGGIVVAHWVWVRKRDPVETDPETTDDSE